MASIRWTANRTAISGQDYALHCPFAGYPILSITWYRNSQVDAYKSICCENVLHLCTFLIPMCRSYGKQTNFGYFLTVLWKLPQSIPLLIVANILAWSVGLRLQVLKGPSTWMLFVISLHIEYLIESEKLTTNNTIVSRTSCDWTFQFSLPSPRWRQDSGDLLHLSWGPSHANYLVQRWPPNRQPFERRDANGRVP